MMKLTKKHKDGTYGIADVLPYGENSHEFKKLLIDKLGEYEHQEPCNFCKTVGEFAPIDFVNCSMSNGVGVEREVHMFNCIRCGRKLEVEE